MLLSLLYAVYVDAMAPVAGDVELLMLLQQSPPQLTSQQVATCRKASLLAIGACIDAGPPRWMSSCPMSDESLWQYVSKATRHSMTGPQLQHLYASLTTRQEQERAELSRLRGARQSARRLQQLKQEEEKAKACMATARALVPQLRTPFPGLPDFMRDALLAEEGACSTDHTASI